ncbi:hypothetical protein MtrunA17_Chr0c01g0489631 [Medicago truncatula]|uniref:Transposase (putative) gypsy type domain-containing protein n=1 Tax=Medicago truncatula TaxID=3880 RepID=A0A396GD22_MEDTR|nr:hypothetical protein MtrunA17_Chr0c01g0489631 [Medicago truncatula]
MEEEDQIAAATELVTRELEKKKVEDAAALAKARELAKAIEVPVSSIAREDIGVSAQKVKSTEKAQKIGATSSEALRGRVAYEGLYRITPRDLWGFYETSINSSNVVWSITAFRFLKELEIFPPKFIFSTRCFPDLQLSTPESFKFREEPQETESILAGDGVGEIPFGSIGRVDDWELLLPSTSDRVCSEYGNHVFPMYEVVFKDMGFRLPFSEFQREMLRWTKLSPSQIHPNSYAFMRAFELMCDYLHLLVSKNVFFSFFTVKGGTDWVSFRLTQKMFEVFAGKVQSFKERFFLVHLRSATALDSLLEGVRDGVQGRRPFFSLCWSQDHFCYEPKDFGRSTTSLSEEEIDIRLRLCAFVQSLLRRVKTDKRGNPLMSADGTPVTERRLINTHELLTSGNPEGCLGKKMKDLGALVNAAHKKVSAKKRRKNV